MTNLLNAHDCDVDRVIHEVWGNQMDGRGNGRAGDNLISPSVMVNVELERGIPKQMESLLLSMAHYWSLREMADRQVELLEKPLQAGQDGFHPEGAGGADGQD